MKMWLLTAQAWEVSRSCDAGLKLFIMFVMFICSLDDDTEILPPSESADHSEEEWPTQATAAL